MVLLSFGGDLVGRGLRQAAVAFGVSATLLGNTVVTASVELEEVGRLAIPSRRGRQDLAYANVFGTAVHFLTLNAGVIALVRPLALDTPTRFLHLPVCVGAIALVSAIAVWRGVGRAAGAGLLALYGSYIAAAVLFR